MAILKFYSEVDQIIQQLNPLQCIFGDDHNADLEKSSPQTAELKQFI